MRGGRGRGARPARGARAQRAEREADIASRRRRERETRDALRADANARRDDDKSFRAREKRKRDRGQQGGGGKDWVQEEKRALREAAGSGGGSGSTDEPHTREPTVPGKAHDATRTNVRNEPTVARRVMGDKTRLAARSSETPVLAPPPSSLRPSPSHPLRCRRDHLRRDPPRRDPRSRRRQTRSRRRQTRSRRRCARRARHHLRLPAAAPAGDFLVLITLLLVFAIAVLVAFGASQVRRELILQLHVLHGIREVRGDDGHERLSAKSIVQTRDRGGGGRGEPRPGS